MGIHNESGNKRLSPVPSLHDLVQQLLDLLLTTTDPERSFLNVKGSGDEVVLLVNNLGGLSELEIAAIVREVERSLGGRKVKVQRVLAGTFMVRLSYNFPTRKFDLHKSFSKSIDKFEHARFLPYPPASSHRLFIWPLRRPPPQAPRRSHLRPRLEVALRQRSLF